MWSAGGRRDRRIDGVTKLVDELADLVGPDDVGGRQQDVIATPSVDRAARRITHQAARHRLALDARVQLQLGREWLLASTVDDQLDAAEEPAATDVPGVVMVAEPIIQSPRPSVAA